MKSSLLVLAAGMGSRFGGIKQMSAVGAAGETLLEYSVYDAVEAGFDEIVFLIRRSMEEDFRSLVLARLPARVKRRLVFQEPGHLPGGDGLAAPPRARPWGTGHALLCAAEALDSPFAVINADDAYGRRSLAMIHDSLAAVDGGRPEFCMAGYALENTTSPFGPVSRGICDLDAQGRLERVLEHKAITREGAKFVSRSPEGTEVEIAGDATVSMNLWGFTRAIFPLARPLFGRFVSANASSPTAEFYLPAVVDELVAAGRAIVRVRPTPDVWFGLTFREDLAGARDRVAAQVAAGVYPSPLWARG